MASLLKGLSGQDVKLLNAVDRDHDLRHQWQLLMSPARAALVTWGAKEAICNIWQISASLRCPSGQPKNQMEPNLLA